MAFYSQNGPAGPPPYDANGMENKGGGGGGYGGGGGGRGSGDGGLYPSLPGGANHDAAQPSAPSMDEFMAGRGASRSPNTRDHSPTPPRNDDYDSPTGAQFRRQQQPSALEFAKNMKMDVKEPWSSVDDFAAAQNDTKCTAVLAPYGHNGRFAGQTMSDEDIDKGGVPFRLGLASTGVLLKAAGAISAHVCPTMMKKTEENPGHGKMRTLRSKLTGYHSRLMFLVPNHIYSFHHIHDLVPHVFPLDGATATLELDNTVLHVKNQMGHSIALQADTAVFASAADRTAHAIRWKEAIDAAKVQTGAPFVHPFLKSSWPEFSQALISHVFPKEESKRATGTLRSSKGNKRLSSGNVETSEPLIPTPSAWMYKLIWRAWLVPLQAGSFVQRMYQNFERISGMQMLDRATRGPQHARAFARDFLELLCACAQDVVLCAIIFYFEFVFPPRELGSLINETLQSTEFRDSPTTAFVCVLQRRCYATLQQDRNWARFLLDSLRFPPSCRDTLTRLTIELEWRKVKGGAEMARFPPRVHFENRDLFDWADSVLKASGNATSRKIACNGDFDIIFNMPVCQLFFARQLLLSETPVVDSDSSTEASGAEPVLRMDPRTLRFFDLIDSLSTECLVEQRVPLADGKGTVRPMSVFSLALEELQPAFFPVAFDAVLAKNMYLERSIFVALIHSFMRAARIDDLSHVVNVLRQEERYRYAVPTAPMDIFTAAFLESDPTDDDPSALPLHSKYHLGVLVENLLKFSYPPSPPEHFQEMCNTVGAILRQDDSLRETVCESLCDVANDHLFKLCDFNISNTIEVRPADVRRSRSGLDTSSSTGDLDSDNEDTESQSDSSSMMNESNLRNDDDGDDEFGATRTRDGETLDLLIDGLWRLLLAIDDVRPMYKLTSRCEKIFRTRLSTGMPSTSSLRNRMTSTLATSRTLVKDAENALRTGMTMTTPSFFRQEVMSLFVRDEAPPAQDVGTQLYVDAVCTFIDLLGTDLIVPQVSDLVSEVRRGQPQVKQAHLRVIVRAMNKKKRSSFRKGSRYVLRIADVKQCVVYAIDAEHMLGERQALKLLQGCFRHYLSKEPDAWLAMFKSVDKVALFIRYMDRENLALAYKEFYQVNRVADVGPSGVATTETARWFADVLPEAAERLLPPDEPIINTADLQPETQLSGEKSQLILDVESKAEAETDATRKTLLLLSARWMERMQKSTSIPMSLHHTQSIAFLVFAHFFQCMTDASMRHRLPMVQVERAGRGQVEEPAKMLIAQVGTGEGKSVLICMVAVYLVTVCKRRVHVLENNVALRSRDYNLYRDYYGQFKKEDGTFIRTSENLNDAHADIIYCLHSEIDSLARKDQESKGKSLFDNTVLVVDEVDDLVIDNKPTSFYVKPDVQKSPFAREYFEVLKRGGSAPPDANMPVWNACVNARQSSLRMRRGIDYDLFGSRYRLLDKRGRQSSLTSLELEYLNFANDMSGGNPEFQTVFSVISTPYVFKKYEALFGLSGSLGGESERRFLINTYAAKIMRVPTFLDTCNGTSKPETVCTGLTLSPTAKQLKRDVVAMAVKSSRKTPVLVIAATEEEARELFEAANAKASDNDACQLFVEHDDKGKSTSSEWDNVVTKATQDTSKGGWRITFTSYFGGRGHDYKVTDENVNAAGGMLVIMTTVPDSEREWTQWVGRTARQDRRGRFHVFLNQAGSLLTGIGRTVAVKTSSDESESKDMVAQLLAVQDEEARKKLPKEEEMTRGMQMNALCDAFYRKYGRAAHWPGTDEEIKLRNFLDGHGGTLSEMNAFAKSVGLSVDLDSI